MAAYQTKHYRCLAVLVISCRNLDRDRMTVLTK